MLKPVPHIRPSRERVMTENGVNGNGAKRAAERWRLAKEIPLSVIGVIVLQTVVGTWWLSQLASKLDSAVTNLAEFKIERYTRDDARRDRELIEQKLSAQGDAAAERIRRIGELEGRVQRLEQAAPRK